MRCLLTWHRDISPKAEKPFFFASAQRFLWRVLCMTFEAWKCSGSHVVEMSWWSEADTSVCRWLPEFLLQGCGSPAVTFFFANPLPGLTEIIS